MDVHSLRKKALFIPTEGQTEQEYLAAHLKCRNLFYFVKESELDLEKDVELALQQNEILEKKEVLNYRSAIVEFLESV